MVDDDYEKIMRELRIEQVSKAIKENPKNWSRELEELGFQWFDDENNEEQEEERSAKPENPDQELIVGYFHEFKNILDELIQLYLNACEKENAQVSFEELVRDFSIYTEPDGFDALYELEQKYGRDSEKGKILLKIRQGQDLQPEYIKF